MTDESDRARKYKKGIAYPEIDRLISFGITHPDTREDVEEHQGNVSIDIEDEIWFFLEGDHFHREAIVEEMARREALSELSEDQTALIRIVFTLYLVPNPWDRSMFPLHPFDESTRGFSFFDCLEKGEGRSIDRSSKSRADRLESGDQ